MSTAARLRAAARLSTAVEALRNTVADEALTAEERDRAEGIYAAAFDLEATVRAGQEADA